MRQLRVAAAALQQWRRWYTGCSCAAGSAGVQDAATAQRLGVDDCSPRDSQRQDCDAAIAPPSYGRRHGDLGGGGRLHIRRARGLRDDEGQRACLVSDVDRCCKNKNHSLADRQQQGGSFVRWSSSYMK